MGTEYTLQPLIRNSQPQRIQQRHSGEFRTRGDQISRALMHCGDRSSIIPRLPIFYFSALPNFD